MDTSVQAPAPFQQRPSRALFVTLRLFLAIIVLGFLGGAFSMKFIADDLLAMAPEFAQLYWPLLLLSWAVIGCGLLFWFALWRLLGRVKKDEIFGLQSLRLVDVLIHSCGVAAVLSAIATVLIPGPPLLGIGMVALVLILLALSLTVRVMKYLLLQAVEYRTELDVVI